MTRRYTNSNRFEYTTEMLDWLRQHRPTMPPKELAPAFNSAFKTDKSFKTLVHTCAKQKIYSLYCGQFKKGGKPHNAGSAGTGLMKANKTSFKKGEIPLCQRPVGTERTNVKDGYIMIKTANPRTWQLKHVWLWEQTHGPKKPNHVIRFIDGDKTNMSLDNLECVRKAEIVIFNKRFSKAPDAIKPAAKALIKLHVLNKELKKEKNLG